MAELTTIKSISSISPTAVVEILFNLTFFMSFSLLHSDRDTTGTLKYVALNHNGVTVNIIVMFPDLEEEILLVDV